LGIEQPALFATEIYMYCISFSVLQMGFGLGIP
jgi:hypothetical protein